MLDTVALDKAELLTAMRYDCVAFFSFYLQDELELEVPDFHEEIWNELLGFVEECNKPAVVRTLRKLFAVPREHAKSTLAKLAVILFLKYTPLAFCLYVSKTNSIAKNAIRDILIWLSSPQEVELYGRMGTVKSSETESLWIVDIWVWDAAQRQMRLKRCIFKALGADQQVRGTLILNRRPQLVVIDDLEDLDNTKDAKLQKSLDEWFAGSLMKSFARNNIVIMLGNMIRKTTLLARLAKDPEWNPTVFGALVRDREDGSLRALWQGRWTVDGLLKDYHAYQKLGLGHTWEAEMMNLTQDEVLGHDLRSVIRVPDPVPEDLESGVIILDPAFGQNAWNDESAITVHAHLKDMKIPVIIDSWKGRAVEEEVFDRMLEMSYRWGICTWCIESVAAQRLFIPYFRLLFKERGMNPDAILILPIVGGKQAKSSRIVAIINSVSSGSYGITESQEEVLDALANYNPEDEKAHDDLPDSAAFGLIAWNSYDDVISSRGVTKVAFTLLDSANANLVAQYGAAVDGF